ncbi:MAG: hypothetical protein GY714_19940 [Desulfobacterales bacterium]|nr:hypothetical protein [Desulfobacterales bacterium]
MQITKIQKSTFDLSAKAKPKAMKSYKVTINWHGERFYFKANSMTEQGALRNAMWGLSKRLQVSYSSVKFHTMDSQKDRWKVKEIGK